MLNLTSLTAKLGMTASMAPAQTLAFSNDCQQKVSLFMKTSNFTRYLLDEVLPDLISKSNFVIPEEIVEECDVLLVSVRTFIQLVKVVQTKLRESENVGIVEELWRDVFYEMYSNINQTTGVAEKKGHYCGLCNYHSFCTQEWNDHLRNDKTHNTRNDLAKEEKTLVEGTYCKFCGVILYSERIHLDLILNSKDHKALDSKVKRCEPKPMLGDTTPQATNNSSASTSVSNFPNTRTNNSLPFNPPIKWSECKDFQGSTASDLSRKSRGSRKGGKGKNNDNQIEQMTRNQKKKKNSGKELTGIKREEKFGSTVITDDFQIVCEKLVNKQWDEAFYCRPCSKVFIKKREWTNHCNTVIHQDGNMINSCNICKFAFYVFRMHSKDYMGYHLKKCHQNNNTTQQWCSESDISTRLDHDGNSDFSTHNSSRISSPRYQSSTPDIYIHPTPPIQASPVRSVNILNSPISSVNADDLINPKFYDLMEGKRQYFDETQIQTFRGLCIKCDMEFLDQFQWLDHTDKHEIKKDEENYTCPLCNFGLFGKKELIHGVYLQDPVHISMDNQQQQ